MGVKQATLPAATGRTAADAVRTYRVKEIFRTLQGEGFWAGRPAVFVRLVGCNMWSGYEADRERDAARTGADCPRWCFGPETPVLMADYSQKPIGQVEVGDRVLCARLVENRVKLAKTTVQNTLRRKAQLSLLYFSDQTLVGTARHRIMTRGSKKRAKAFVPAEEAVGQETYRLPVRGIPVQPCNREYWRGWMAGIAFGDGCFWTLQKSTNRRKVPYDRSSAWVETKTPYRRFRLAMHDRAVVEAFEYRAISHGFEGFRWIVHNGTGHSPYRMDAIELTRSKVVCRLEEYLMEENPSPDYARGYLAGIFDVEGTTKARGLHLCQDRAANSHTYALIKECLKVLDLDFTATPNKFSLYGQAAFSFLMLCTPMTDRKFSAFLGRDLGFCYGRLEAVEETPVMDTVVNLTTEVGNYFAGGHLVKNCDTDFTKEGSTAYSADALVDAIIEEGENIRFCVLTGGEPFLQADSELIEALHAAGFQVAVETNGTVTLEEAFWSEERGEIVPPDWIVCSPKLPEERLVLEHFDELKLVVPDYRPEAYAGFAERAQTRTVAGHDVPLLWLQPEDGPRLEEAKRMAVDLALEHPDWRVSVQTHKVLGIE